MEEQGRKGERQGSPAWSLRLILQNESGEMGWPGNKVAREAWDRETKKTLCGHCRTYPRWHFLPDQILVSLLWALFLARPLSWACLTYLVLLGILLRQFREIPYLIWTLWPAFSTFSKIRPCLTRDWTDQGLMHDRQLLYHWATPPTLSKNLVKSFNKNSPTCDVSLLLILFHPLVPHSTTWL